MSESDKIPTLSNPIQNQEEAATTIVFTADEEELRQIIAPIIQAKLRHFAAELEEQIIAELISSELPQKKAKP